MKKIISALLAVVLSLSVLLPVSAADKTTVNAAVLNTAEYVYKTVKNPQVGSIGGEWAVLGLARSGFSVPQSYYDAYYKTVEEYVKACNGVLHDKKYTEYSRVILGLTAAGFDPRNVGGYDLTLALGDFEKTVWQGINGPVFALISLDSGGYGIPKNTSAKTQATHEMYIEEILRRQLPDGGFNLTAGAGGAAITNEEKADPDLTGMALQALAKYQSDKTVKNATDKALACLSKMQDKSGGFSSYGTKNSESVVQVIVALCELGIPPDDARFVKNGNSLADNLLTYYKRYSGFNHTANGSGSNQMATEQGLYGLVAIKRYLEGKLSLYRMSDTKISIGKIVDTGVSFPNRNADIKKAAITAPGKTFTDIQAHVNQTAIEALASRGVISGKSANLFDPNATMTRAEFAAIVVRTLGLTPKANSNFIDVGKNDWFAGYVGTAYSYGLVSGTSTTTFSPGSTITRQEAAVMVARAAKLAGLDTETDAVTVKDILAQFGDYVTAADWAKQAMAFCYSEDILPQDVFCIKPEEAVNRAEIAEMLFRMLGIAKLL